MMDYYKCGNGSLGSINGMTFFLDKPEKLALSLGGLYCIKLILLKTFLTKFVPFNEINMSFYLYKQ
jgi:hypothetical protein